MTTFKFSVTARELGSQARAGLLSTAHGVVETPAVVPIASQATVKSLAPDEIRAVGAQAVIADLYYLLLRPGVDQIAHLGGLHDFMSFSGPLLTNSGSAEIFRLPSARSSNRELAREEPNHIPPASQGSGLLDTRQRARGQEGRLVRVDADRVTFTSYVDGSRLTLSPEAAITLQESLGSDIAIALDYPSENVSRANAWTTDRALAWARRSLGAHTHPEQALFGVIPRPREVAFADVVRDMGQLPFDGFVVELLSLDTPSLTLPLRGGGDQVQLPLRGGGDQVQFPLRGGGDPMRLDERRGWLAATLHSLPGGLPRLLTGAIEVEDLFAVVAAGGDLISTQAPVRDARQGLVYTKNGRLRLDAPWVANDFGAVEPGCRCETCRLFSRAYLHHLFNARELLGYRLATIHNLTFVQQLLARIRAAITGGTFAAVHRDFGSAWYGGAAQGV